MHPSLGSIADAPGASAAHIDVSLPAAITTRHAVLCMFRKRYFWLRSMQDAIQCPFTPSFEDSKNTPEFETALQLDLQYRRSVETESTGLLDSEVIYKAMTLADYPRSSSLAVRTLYPSTCFQVRRMTSISCL